MSRDIKLFFNYIMPSMAGMLIAGTYSVVDTFFIGQAMGEIGLAAVALTWPMVMIFGAIGDMIGTGSAILISQSRGAGDLKKCQLLFENMIIAQLFFGCVFMLGALYFLKDILIFLGASEQLMPLSYPYTKIMVYGVIPAMFTMAWLAVIRNDGRPVLAMILTCAGLLMNMLLDYIFIFPLNMGVSGAAVATVISQCCVLIIGIVYFRSTHTQLRLLITQLRFHFGMQILILKNGIPTLGNQLSIIAMLLFHNIQALAYGAVAGLASYTLIAAIESVGSLLMTGLSAGIQPLVAFFYGSGKHKRKRRIGIYGYWSAFFFGILMTIISILGYKTFPVWFGLSGDVAKMAGHGLLLSSGAFIFLGVIRVAGYYFQSTGKLVKSSVLIYGDSFFALPLCLFILPLFFNLDGVWLAMPISRAILLLIVIYFWYGDILTKKIKKETENVER